MHAAAETTIGTRNQVLTTNNPSKADKPVSDELGMLNKVCGVAHHAWNEQLAVGELRVLPNLPFVLMTNISRFYRIGFALTLIRRCVYRKPHRC